MPTRLPLSRSVSLLVVLAATAGMLSACSADDTPPSDASAAPLLPAAEEATRYPLTLESPYGDSVLERRPERVAAIVPNAIDTELLIALGVTPVLSSNMVTEGGYLDEYGAEDLDTYEVSMGEDLPVEAIAASDPDLIVAVGWTEGYGGLRLSDVYGRLTDIAPVVMNPDADSAQAVPWQESIMVLGEALDLAGAAQRVIDEHEAWFTELREDHPEFAGLTATWAMEYGASTGLQYWSQPGSASESFLQDLGFVPNPRAGQFASSRDVSAELVSELDADVLLMGRVVSTTDAEYDALVSSDRFQRLGAVSKGHLVELPAKTDDGGDLTWAIVSGGPIGNRWAAEQLAPQIAAVL